MPKCVVFYISNRFFPFVLYMHLFSIPTCVKLCEELVSAKVWCFQNFIFSNAMGLICSKEQI